MWRKFLALLLAALATTPKPPEMPKSLTLESGCQPSCGGVEVPYPFGIGQGCFREGFEIICINNNMTFLRKSSSQSTKIQVLSLAVTPRPEAKVMLPMAYQCYNLKGEPTKKHEGDVDFNKAGVYRISNTRNELFVLGCNTLSMTNSGPGGRHQFSYYAGCVAYANDSMDLHDGACAGVGCCHIDIPPDLTDNTMRFANDGNWLHANQEFCPCDYAFIVEKGYYTFHVADLNMMLSNKWPLLLDWAIRDSGGSPLSCAEAASNMPGHKYTCVSNHSECVDSANGPGYFCNCTLGYEGNPYLANGCTSIGLGVFFLVVGLLLVYIMHQKKKLAENFEMNGGNILKRVTDLTIFTEKDLNKITKNYSKCLGNGFFGKVYKGTLPDASETVVAVKSFIKVDEERIEEFTEEVMIQLKMNHPNVLKLMGCCLQLDVPMLVYEFAANGSLRDILHINKRQKLSTESRLDIAIGSAKGLRYMHSQDIRHGDVKPDNILLNDKLIPKISDFGLSKLLKLGEKIAQKVVGCEGYMDPVFRNTGLLTPKSDVYSFGVVLLELISRKQLVYGQSGSLVIEFRHIYETEQSGRSMFDEEIVTEENILILEEIGKLAMKCLKEHQDG
ncbi:Wall-associated receptor kinase 4 [Triticum urartu]|uniref:Wall-associated receptor kinase 4 n=2 Tax=Triticum urartu TaxID=4572 RepID=M8B1Q8_TRIUA|nr:Wall-associated receptor kinase 4 [Triticum urartu]